jgi:hypothetical protein
LRTSRHNGSNFSRGELKRILSHHHTIAAFEDRYDFTIDMGFDKRDSSSTQRAFLPDTSNSFVPGMQQWQTIQKEQQKKRNNKLVIALELS